ncbi:MAG TPA: SpoIID/LytB domain-containing protein, partial [Tepidisphaeraceae bacterium]|nr:SpoIID/LytB domain-containing protein [Tepidisphaeraceae bacterium]
MRSSDRYGRRDVLRWMGATALTSLLPVGCSQDGRGGTPAGTPMLRVLLLENQPHVSVAASDSPSVRVGGQSTPQQLHFGTSAVPITLTASGWRIGSAQLGLGEMILDPATTGSITLAGKRYHGRFRFVPAGANHFDVINELDLETYLRGVLSSELFPNWHEEAYKAQAIVARTYALYEARTDGLSRNFDVFADQRSQVYGGISAETARSRQATQDTMGIVVASGPVGREVIFKSYFSSCCGGIGQSAYDAFG